MSDDTVFEDIGYRRPEDMQDVPRSSDKIRKSVQKKSIRYVKGMRCGDSATMAAQYADELIASGMAVEITREVGQEG